MAREIRLQDLAARPTNDSRQHNTLRRRFNAEMSGDLRHQVTESPRHQVETYHTTHMK